MTNIPFWPVDTGAYLGDTPHLTVAQHGAYYLILVALWRSKDGRLPADQALLAATAAHTHLGTFKTSIWPAIQPLFQTLEVDGKCHIIQARITRDRLRAGSRVAARAAAGRAGATARWRKPLIEQRADMARAMLARSQPHQDRMRMPSLELEHKKATPLPPTATTGSGGSLAAWNAARPPSRR